MLIKLFNYPSIKSYTTRWLKIVRTMGWTACCQARHPALQVREGNRFIVSITPATVSRLIGTLQPGSLVQDRLAAHLVSEEYYKTTVQSMQALADTNTVQFYQAPSTPPTTEARPPCDLICLRTRFIDDELVELLQELAPQGIHALPY